jgi:hypothetical protein
VLSQRGEQFRRGLYTFWRRTAPYASFAAFDAPSREVMCERRARSNTPVQALVTLNDPAFVAAANGLARAIMRCPSPSPEERMTYAFERCLARRPAPEEMRPLMHLYQDTLHQFQSNLAGAKSLTQIGWSDASPGTDPAACAAWMVIANVLLNLDETLTKG